MNRDHKDLVIEELADCEAELRDATHHLTDLIADLAFENECLRVVCGRFIDRIRQLTRDRDCERAA